MTRSPLWFRRLLVGGVSTLTVGGLAMTGLLSTAGTAGATSTFKINPLSGPDRFATAAAIAAAEFPSGAGTVIVASGLQTNLPDALAASYLAAQQNGGKGAPILLVNANSVPAETAQAILTLKATNIIIVGGTDAVTASVESTLTNNGAITVSRVAGTDRFLTADAIDSQTGDMAVGPKKTAIIADGVNSNLVDALGASPLAAAGPYPMFLVNGPTGDLSATDLSILKTDGITNAITVGGSAAIGPQIATELTTAGITSQNESGSDRSATSEALANYEISNYGFSKTEFNIAGGAQPNLVDALTGGPLGGMEMAPTLITDSPTNAGSVTAFATANAATENSANLFGGSAGVSATTEAAIVAAAQSTPATATTLPQLLTAKVISTDPVLGTTVQYTFSQPVLSATFGDFKLYTADGTTVTPATAATVQTGGTTVNAVFSTVSATTGTGATDINNYTLATVASGAVTTSTGTQNPDGSAAIGSSSTTTLTPGKTNAPNLVSVGNFRASAGDTYVDFTFDAAPTPITAADGSSFGLVSTTGGPDTMGTGTPTVNGDVVTVAFSGTTLGTGSTTARGYVLKDTVKPASGSAVNPLQAAAGPAGVSTTNADLVSASLEPTTNQVLYTFDQAVTGTPLAEDFSVYDVNGTQTPGTTAAVGTGSNDTQVLVTFTGDTFANVVGANVSTDAASNYNADSVGVTNSNSTGATSGTIDAPQLSGVALTTTTNGFGVTSDSATYTFSQPIATGALIATDFHLYTASGTELSGFTCADGAAGTNGVTTVVCSLFGATPGAAPTSTEVLGTVDYGAVTGSTAPNANKNPEGAGSI